MKKHFVLDENVIICAQTGKNIQGGRDSSCLNLLHEIVANCHSLVLTESIWHKYSGQTKTLERQRVLLIPRVMAIIKSLLANAEKDSRFVADHDLIEIEGLEEIRGIDMGDREFVRAAASVPGSILVTTDGPLTRSVGTHGIDQTHGFSVHSPEAALALAGPEND